MRIISKFQDYYDGVQSYGAEPFAFIRHAEKLVDHELPKLEISGRFYSSSIWHYHQMMHPQFVWSRRHIKDQNVDVRRSFVGFCGSWHPVFSFYISNHTRPRWFHTLKSHEIESAARECYKDAKWLREDGVISDELTYWGRSRCKILDRLNLFEKHKQALLYIDIDGDNKPLLTSNPLLKHLGFAKVKDPFTAYQEISMYISGVIGVGEPDTIEVSDECKRDAKGFDEWSFKTHSPGKKAKRRNKS